MIDATMLLRILTERGQTVATAESCTGGGIAEALTAPDGASKVFVAGVVAYQASVKHEVLEVPTAVLAATPGAVSSDVALRMARGVRMKFGTTFGVASTGFTGPTGGTPTEPIGVVYIAVAWMGGERFERLFVEGPRALVRLRAVARALELLIEVSSEAL